MAIPCVTENTCFLLHNFLSHLVAAPCRPPPPHSGRGCYMPNLNDMAEADKHLQRLSHAVCMIDGAALGVVAILDDAWALAGADIDAWLHAVILDPVLSILQNVTQQ